MSKQLAIQVFRLPKPNFKNNNMKSVVLFVVMFISQVVLTAQIITVKLDTCQFFEHPVNISTPDAGKAGLLVYNELYKYNNFLVTFDLDKKISFTHGRNENTIAEINTTSNILDLVVQEKERVSLVVLGATDEGGTIYIYEYKEGELMKGYFCNNPEIIRPEIQKTIGESE